MKILFICPRLPFPPDQGDRIAIYNQLRILSRTNKITLLSTVESEKELENVKPLTEYCERVEAFRRPPNLRLRNFIAAALKPDPFTVIKYFCPDMFALSKTLIESGAYDIVHISYYYMAQYALNKKICVPAKTAVVLDTHNVECLIYSRYARLLKDPLMKFLFWLESQRIKKYELAVYKKFDKCLVASELDRQNIKRLAGATNIEVNPFCVELGCGSAAQAATEQPNTILFFGGLKYVANDDAVRFFYEKIFPMIQKEVPQVKFVICGKYPSKHVLRIARDPSVNYLGLVPDIKTVLRQAALVVVPLRLGGGIRMKILDAWCAGRAVVSTSIGGEGIDYTDRQDIYIADTPEQFAAAVVTLLKDKELRDKIALAGNKKVNTLYVPENIIANLQRIYESVRLEKEA